MPEPTVQEVHARVDQRAREAARPGHWWMRQVSGQSEDDNRVISPEELEAIYARAERMEQK